MYSEVVLEFVVEGVFIEEVVDDIYIIVLVVNLEVSRVLLDLVLLPQSPQVCS